MKIERAHYLDWLRMMAILGVLFFHSAMPYAAEWNWHINNAQKSNLFLEFNYWLSRFRMPLLFFVSGAVTYFILRRRTARSFIAIRFKRLIIPLLFGMLVIVPPQIYLERVNEGFAGNYWAFFPSIFKGTPYPEGNLSWHHLWFILYLFVYNAVAAPLMVYFLSERGRRAISIIGNLGKGKRIYLLILPGVAWYTLTTWHYPQTNNLIGDPAYLVYWFFFLLAGFICFVSTPLMESLERNRRFSLALAFGSMVVINYFRWNSLEPWSDNSNYTLSWDGYLLIALRPLTAWCWVLAVIGYGKRYLNRQHRALHYINEAVYPFYILHQTVIVVLSFYVVKTNDDILSKYLFTVLCSFVITMMLYHVFVRPFNTMRYLFGMNPRNRMNKMNTDPSPSIINPPVAAVKN